MNLVVSARRARRWSMDLAGQGQQDDDALLASQTDGLARLPDQFVR
jgi:hypothetical protein